MRSKHREADEEAARLQEEEARVQEEEARLQEEEARVQEEASTGEEETVRAQAQEAAEALLQLSRMEVIKEQETQTGQQV